jgi:hypothetical protein
VTNSQEYRRQAAHKIFTKLPAKERADTEALARAKYPKSRGQGSLAQLMSEIEIAVLRSSAMPIALLHSSSGERSRNLPKDLPLRGLNHNWGNMCLVVGSRLEALYGSA